MKKLQKIIALSFLIIGALSCSDDDDKPGEDFASIIGEWEFVSSTTDGVPDEPEDDCSIIVEFIDDSKIDVTETWGENCEDSDFYSITYTLVGDQLTTSDEGYTYVSKILTLTETSLVVEDIDEGEVYVETYRRL